MSLALVVMSVCQRLGIESHGVSFPGHFLLRFESGEGATVFADPFEGEMLSTCALRQLYHQATGDFGDVEPCLLAPADRTQILLRMLNNLRLIYEVRGEEERLQWASGLMEVLAGAGTKGKSTARTKATVGIACALN